MLIRSLWQNLESISFLSFRSSTQFFSFFKVSSSFITNDLQTRYSWRFEPDSYYNGKQYFLRQSLTLTLRVKGSVLEAVHTSNAIVLPSPYPIDKRRDNVNIKISQNDRRLSIVHRIANHTSSNNDKNKIRMMMERKKRYFHVLKIAVRSRRSCVLGFNLWSAYLERCETANYLLTRIND